MSFSLIRYHRGSPSRQLSHAGAGAYERDFAADAIRADVPRLWGRRQEAMVAGSLWHGPDDQWFQVAQKRS